MAAEHERRRALEAIDRILNRGGDADDVLREVLQVLFQLYAFVGIDFVENGGLVPGPSLGVREEAADSYPVRFQGAKVAELVIAFPDEADQEFLERVAVLISHHCLVGWDTGGEAWEP